MNTTTKMIVVLTAITALSGGVLSYWDAFTSPKISYHRLQALKAAIAEVLPPHDEYRALSRDGVTLYIGEKSGHEQPVGIAFFTAGNGFQGKISMMLGVNPEFSELTGLKILEQVETPGLGTRIVEDPSHKTNPYWFTEQFKKLSLAKNISVIKNAKPQKPSEIQAITGATISSQAVARIINDTRDKAKTVYESLAQGNK
jgi:electron transport complex protein RnfG